MTDQLRLDFSLPINRSTHNFHKSLSQTHSVLVDHIWRERSDDGGVSFFSTIITSHVHSATTDRVLQFRTEELASEAGIRD